VEPGHVQLSPALVVKRPARRDERGVTLILFTLMITVMLVFVALAMDSGLVFNERRQDQSAADAAVLAAAQLLLDGGTRAAAAEAIVTSSFTNTKSTNGVPLDGPGGWHERWAGCSATVPTGFVRAPSSECIAFRDISPQNDTTKVWAHLPPITVGSTFGGVVGINEYKSTAEATAEIFLGEPYAVFAGATDCDFVGPVEEVVDIGSQGSSGRIDIHGPVHSNGQVQVLWPVATLDDFVTYVKPPSPPPTIQSRLTDRQSDPLADITIENYEPGGTKAVAAGNLYRDAGNATVDDAWLDDPAHNVLDGAGHLKNVLIYTTGRIDVEVARQGQATFVSTQRITFKGDGFDLTARTGDVLAFSTAGDHQCGGDAGEAIRFEGGNNTWTGVIYAPEGDIRSGVNQESDPPGLKTFDGGLIGWIVDLDGSNFTIKNQQSLGTPTKVRLFE
jgi:Tfp pilus assembly protein PilX